MIDRITKVWTSGDDEPWHIEPGSVEIVQLFNVDHLAFDVTDNRGRVLVRLSAITAVSVEEG